ncbi:hypothetical protein M514_00849 [Trichuris suis]|uniref:Uncharacterized protein n=1 Tax=Trichuris suis TaxID=68888 RepID=A0A085MVE9_9BILA|nr:hypothetical protein M513_00849 [Trichuris suis]KFD61195.1 hypothetical protein M514_00849 [Trichuris suis]
MCVREFRSERRHKLCSADISSVDDEISDSVTEEGSAKDQLLDKKIEEEKGIVEQGKANEDGDVEGRESVDEVSDVEEQGNEEEKESAEEQTNVHDERNFVEKESIREQESIVVEEELSDVESAGSVVEDDGDSKPDGSPENVDLEGENGLPPSKEGNAIVGDMQSDSLEEANVSLSNSSNASAVHD